MAELMGRDRLIDACPIDEPPQIRMDCPGTWSLTAGLIGKHKLLLGFII
jgi:hypothetical protein